MKRSYIEEHEMVALIISAMEIYSQLHGNTLDKYCMHFVRTFIYGYQCEFQIKGRMLRVYHGTQHKFSLAINDHAFPDGLYWCVPRKLSQESRDKIEQARDVLIL